jgi:nucleoside-diphosphate-sugar epimerase
MITLTSEMESNIKGKVVAITGASSGIGEATALKLAAMGAQVVLGARRTDRLQQLVSRIVNSGGKAVFIAVDVTKRNDLVEMVQVPFQKPCGRNLAASIRLRESHLAAGPDVQKNELEHITTLDRVSGKLKPEKLLRS